LPTDFDILAADTVQCACARRRFGRPGGLGGSRSEGWGAGGREGGEEGGEEEAEDEGEGEVRAEYEGPDKARRIAGRYIAWNLRVLHQLVCFLPPPSHTQTQLRTSVYPSR
jgi:hypothetical protein